MRETGPFVERGMTFDLITGVCETRRSTRFAATTGTARPAAALEPDRRLPRLTTVRCLFIICARATLRFSTEEDGGY